jgi:4-diphosphocytidyl-2-C-methyl-D-erythritol kinase
MNSLSVEAPAKLNLSLRVTGRRQDGYHELESLLVLIEVADRLLLMAGASGLRIEGPAAAGVPLDAANLAWRGLLAGLGGGEPELACLTLEKRIPAAAGLGGGSSDAAAAWRLGRRWRGAEELAGPGNLLALSGIGADVPFFAAGVGAAVVTGIGEKVNEVSLATSGSVHVILVEGPRPLSTAAVFAELRPAEWSADRELPLDPLAVAPNDLLGAARRLRPELDDLFRLVLGAGGVPRLTGSGPTVFTLTDDEARSVAVAARLKRGGLRVTETRLRAEPASIEPLSEDEEGR